MTTARFFRQDGLLCGFTVAGHTGYASSGSDIVCAAVSTAVHMTALALTEVLGLCADIAQKDGKVSLRLPVSSLAPAQPYLQMLELELKEISRQYPEHVRITNRERREFKCFS